MVFLDLIMINSQFLITIQSADYEYALLSLTHKVHITAIFSADTM